MKDGRIVRIKGYFPLTPGSRNYRAINEQILRSPELAKALEQAAREAADDDATVTAYQTEGPKGRVRVRIAETQKTNRFRARNKSARQVGRFKL